MSQWQDITCPVYRCRQSGALTADVEISRDPCKAQPCVLGVCVCVCVRERERERGRERERKRDVYGERFTEGSRTPAQVPTRQPQRESACDAAPTHTAVQGSEREIPAPAAQARSRTLAGANTCFHVSHHGPMRAWLARAAAEPAYRARY